MFGMRTYEEQRVSAYAQGALGLAFGLFVIRDPRIVIPVFIGMAWIDPLAGLCRRRGWNRVIPTATYFALFLGTVLLMHSFAIQNALFFSAAATVAAILVEGPKHVQIDDDFLIQVFPMQPPRLEKSRTAPFWRIVRSITSTLLSGRSSFTFIRSALREGPVSHKHFRPREAGRMEKGGPVPSGNKGRSVGPIRGFPNSFEHRNKTYNGRARYRGVGFFESHQGCQRSGRTRADSPRSRQ